MVISKSLHNMMEESRGVITGRYFIVSKTLVSKENAHAQYIETRHEML